MSYTRSKEILKAICGDIIVIHKYHIYHLISFKILFLNIYLSVIDSHLFPVLILIFRKYSSQVFLSVFIVPASIYIFLLSKKWSM